MCTRTITARLAIGASTFEAYIRAPPPEYKYMMVKQIAFSANQAVTTDMYILRATALSSEILGPMFESQATRPDGIHMVGPIDGSYEFTITNLRTGLPMVLGVTSSVVLTLQFSI